MKYSIDRSETMKIWNNEKKCVFSNSAEIPKPERDFTEFSNH